MKAFNQLLMLGAVVFLISGCASGNYQKGSATGAGLQASADKIGQGSSRIDAVLASLNDMVNSPGDLVAQYKKFSGSVSDLESAAEDVKSKVAGMREKGNDYFKEWDEQTALIKNEDLKARSTARKAEVQEKFTQIKMSYVAAADAFKPFLANLKDIQTVLGTDLTAGGINSIKPVAEKANKDAVPLKESISKLIAEFKDLGAAMSTSGAPAAAK